MYDSVILYGFLSIHIIALDIGYYLLVLFLYLMEHFIVSCRFLYICYIFIMALAPLSAMPSVPYFYGRFLACYHKHRCLIDNTAIIQLIIRQNVQNNPTLKIKEEAQEHINIEIG